MDPHLELRSFADDAAVIFLSLLSPSAPAYLKPPPSNDLHQYG